MHGVFVPSELCPGGALHCVQSGIVAYRSKILTRGGVWGQDLLLCKARLRRWSGRCLTFVETFSIGREQLIALADRYPRAESVMRWCAIRLALIRTLQDSAAGKTTTAADGAAPPAPTAPSDDSRDGGDGESGGGSGGGGSGGAGGGRVRISVEDIAKHDRAGNPPTVASRLLQKSSTLNRLTAAPRHASVSGGISSALGGAAATFAGTRGKLGVGRARAQALLRIVKEQGKLQARGALASAKGRLRSAAANDEESDEQGYPSITSGTSAEGEQAGDVEQGASGEHAHRMRRGEGKGGKGGGAAGGDVPADDPLGLNDYLDNASLIDPEDLQDDFGSSGNAEMRGATGGGGGGGGGSGGGGGGGSAAELTAIRQDVAALSARTDQSIRALMDELRALRASVERAPAHHASLAGHASASAGVADPAATLHGAAGYVEAALVTPQVQATTALPAGALGGATGAAAATSAGRRESRHRRRNGASPRVRDGATKAGSYLASPMQAENEQSSSQL